MLRRRDKAFWINDEYDYYATDEKTMVAVVTEEDSPLGNFTGLYNKDGNPLFRPKERVGFKTWK